MELTPAIFGSICFFVLALLIQVWSLVMETRETRTLQPLILSAAAIYAGITILFSAVLLSLGFVFAGVALFIHRWWRARRHREAEAAEAADAAAIAPQGGLDIR